MLFQAHLFGVRTTGGNDGKHWALGVLTAGVLNRKEEGELDPECAQLRAGGKVLGGHSLAEFRWLSCRLLPRGQRVLLG